jgi:hypothetical protein
LLLERVGALMKFRPRNSIDAFQEAVTLAPVGLIQHDGFTTGLPD